jgi:hypothetical protein
MSTYKVIQDVEAEDKLIGPLSLRQFIYAAIAAVCLYLSYFLTTHGAAFMLVILLPVAFTSGFFAFPWGRDQPTEIWALAKIRFFFKPRKRIWDQSGASELVTITAPKKIQQDFTNGLTQTEVQSRLRALADTIDSRGWAIKNSNLNYQQPVALAEPESDRLMGASSLPQPIIGNDIQAADDIMDEQNNAAAQRVDSMINAADRAHRQTIESNLKKSHPKMPSGGNPSQPANYWFLNQPTVPASVPANQVTFSTQVVTPGMEETDQFAPGGMPTPDEKTLVQQLQERRQELPTNAYYGHLHTVQPLSVQQQMQKDAQERAARQPQPTYTETTTSAVPSTQPPMTPGTQAAILQLSKNNDLNVSTIAREAERASQDEVVINLH